MTDPIDILAIAAEVHQRASQRWLSTLYMNYGPDAAACNADAAVALDMAASDLAAAKNFAHDLAAEQNRIEP